MLSGSAAIVRGKLGALIGAAVIAGPAGAVLGGIAGLIIGAIRRGKNSKLVRRRHLTMQRG